MALILSHNVFVGNHQKGLQPLKCFNTLLLESCKVILLQILPLKKRKNSLPNLPANMLNIQLPN